MSSEDDRVRHSVAADAAIVTDPVEVARIEAANAVRQAERVRDYVLQSIEGRPFRLRPSLLLDLNRCAIDGLSSYAGVYRPAGIEIGKSAHTPPDGHQVPELIEDLCDYVNEYWNSTSGIHLSAIVMWRLNWIHPFTDGNGRTSRAASYTVLSAHEQALFPGANTIPEQIVANRGPYYAALEDADKRYASEGALQVGIVNAMEELLASMLATQLRGAFDGATSA